MSQERFDVEHRETESRYVLVDTENGAEIGEESYVDVTGERVFFHTGVAEEFAGQCLASVLVRAAVDHAVAEGLKLVPVCPYVAAWLPKHPEYAEHVVQPEPRHITAIRAR